MAKTKAIIIQVLFGFLVGCSDNANDAQEHHAEPGAQLCPEACMTLENLGCVPKDNTCVFNCEHDHQDGFFWNTECVMNITSCVERVGYCHSIYRDGFQKEDC